LEALNLVQDFSLLLTVAGLAALLSRALRFPILLAYILGGMLLDGITHIQGQEIIHQLSELGVLFLMFYMGLEFDLKKLRQLFGPAILALLFQTFFMLFLGRVLAPILGWGGLNGLFLGGLLAISSTMISIPILAEQNALKKNFSRLCVGILIFEDILAILLLVILSGIAITGFFDWDAVGRITFLVGTFVITIFFIGRLLAPSFIRLLLKFHSEEVLTIASIGFLLAIGLLAEISHFSTALGAFIAGAIFSGTEISEAIEEQVRPIRTLFSAIFFLSIGMMSEPRLLWQYILPISLLTVLVFALKLFSCFLGLFLSGQSGEDSFCASLAKAQIGEFSFVIASLGMSLHVTDEGLLSIAIGVSLGTIVCTTMLSPRAKNIYASILRICPKSLCKISNIYANMLIIIRSHISQNLLLKLAMRPLIHIIFHTFLFLALIITASFSLQYIDRFPFLENWETAANIGVWAGTALISLPILTPIVKHCNSFLLALMDSALASSSSKARNFLPRLSGVLRSTIFAGILLIFGGIFLSVAAPSLPKGVPLYAFFFLILIAGILFRRRMLKLNARVESYFVKTFEHDVTSQMEEQKQRMLKKIQEQASMQLEMAEVSVVEGNCGCNRNIADLPLREQFNVNVAAMRHGKYSTLSPHGQLPLFAGCELVLIGKREDLDRASKFFATPCPTDEKQLFGGEGEFEIAKIYLPFGHWLTGKSLMESSLRKQYGVNVVGIFRANGTLLLPSASEVFLANDTIAVIGSKLRIEQFHRLIDANVIRPATQT
jgi:CPA2 family monovalent cation:H+ antiporter-2